jgi:hypothetical protein
MEIYTKDDIKKEIKVNEQLIMDIELYFGEELEMYSESYQEYIDLLNINKVLKIYLNTME